MSNARNLSNFRPSSSGQVEAGDIADDAVGIAQLSATGTASSATYLRGDNSWAELAGFDSGTVMLFAQTAAPTGWTKDTTNYNNSGLRVVTGTASTGGSVDFTTAFASQTPSGTVDVSGLSAGATTLTTTQIPSHTHNIGTKTDSNAAGGGVVVGSAYGANGNYTSGAAGGGGSHSHAMSGSATFTGSAINLAVKYVDVIRATKD